MDQREPSIDPELRQIARLKLGELERRRAALRAHYDAVERAAAAVADPGERLAVLHRGLAGASFGPRALHPGARNLDDLLAVAGQGGLPPARRAAWAERLGRELEQGRARADHAWLFGALVDEWTAAIAAREAAPEPVEAALLARLLARWSQPGAPAATALLDELLAAFPELAGAGRTELAKAITEDVESAVERQEVADAALRLSQDMYRRPGLRRRAAAVLGATQLQAEYAGALTALLAEPEGFAWPEDGVPVRTLWARNKWRPYLDEGLLLALFLEVVGKRWHSAFTSWHEEVLVGEGGLFAQRAPERTPPSSDAYFVRSAGAGFLASINALSESYTAGDNAMEAPEEIETLIASLPRRIRYERAVAPAQPVVALRIDLADFGLSLPHDFLLAWLERLGVPARWRGFFARYLRARVSVDGRVHEAATGVFPDHPLSLVLGDVLLLALDLHVLRRAGVVLFRLLDDITVVTREPDAALAAWRAVEELCAAAGLAVNRDKSGAACLGGALPAGLPERALRFGPLVLDDDSSAYRIDDASVAATARALGTLLAAPRPLLETVAIYNTYAKFLLRSLAPLVDLGPAHLIEVARHMSALHNQLFGPGASIEDALLLRLRDRFPGDRAAELPPGILYWPITAGGLGLFDPVLSVTSFHVYHRLEPPVARPETALHPDKPLPDDWRRWFNALGQGLRPRRPAITPDLAALLADFWARGRELRGEPPEDDSERRRHRRRPENELAAYWQWVVLHHGPDLIDRFGSFRILEAALVPTHLIASSLISSSVTGQPL